MLATLLLSAALPTVARADSPSLTYPQQAGWTLHLLEGARYGEAVDAAQTLVNRDANAAPSYQIRGTVALLVGSLARAQADFRIAAVRSPEDPATHYGLALCALMAQKPADAEIELEAAHKAQNLTDSQAADVEDAQAYVRFLRGDLAGARELVAKPTGAADPVRQEIGALLAMRADPVAGEAALTKLLETPEGAPRVREDDGVRPLFETAGPGAEPAVTETALRALYAARLGDRMAAAERQSGRAPRVSGTVSLGAEVTGLSDVAFVSFYVDDHLAAMVNAAPYHFDWNTTEAANGQHTIRIEVLDSTSAVLSSKTRAVYVANPGRAARYGGHGDLEAASYDAVQSRLWQVLRLRPARKVAEWTLAEELGQRGDRAGADTHRLIAAALDPAYKDARHVARLLLGRAMPLARVASTRPEALWIGGPAGKEVALTFDDGPNPRKTPALLDALDRAHVPATFFVVGARAALAPTLLRRMAARGDDVENHSYSHPNMAQVAPAVAEEEILRTSVLIRALAGRQPRFFRPPGGNADAAVLGLCHAYGMAGAFWTVDALRAEDEASPQGLLRFVLAQVRPGAIILLHNGADATTAAVPQLAAALRARGYRLVTLRQMAAGGGLRSGAPPKLRE